MLAAGGLRKKSSKVNAFKTKIQISHCCFVHLINTMKTLSLSLCDFNFPYPHCCTLNLLLATDDVKLQKHL